jgi:hypothetical protein
MATVNLTRNLFGVFLDTSRGEGTSTTPMTFDWAQIDLSEIYEYALNPEETTKAYIKDRDDSTKIDRYAPTMDQEIELVRGNKCYDFMFKLFREKPTGVTAMVPALFVYPLEVDGDTTVPAEVYTEAVVSLSALNTQDGKLTFTIKMNGTATLGTVVVESGVPVFTATTATA